MTVVNQHMEMFNVPNPRKTKRVAVSSKRQISIPKEFHDVLGIGDEILIELHGNHLVLRPTPTQSDDFSELILQDLIAEGYEGTQLLAAFKERKNQLPRALSTLIDETKTHGQPACIDELFGENNEE